MIDLILDKVAWFFGIRQKFFDEIDVVFVESFPSNYMEYFGLNTLFILDDLMYECAKGKRLTNLFTKGSHHLNLSIIFITQNLFHKGKEMRDIRLNAQYLFLFKNRIDLSQITHLGRQLYPNHLKFFQESYRFETEKPYSCLLIDLSNNVDERYNRGEIIYKNNDNTKSNLSGLMLLVLGRRKNYNHILGKKLFFKLWRR